MKEFNLSGPGWFDGVSDPVVWILDGAVAYYNPAASALAERAGWSLAEGAPPPACLAELPADGMTACSCGGGTWQCRSRALEGGVLLQMTLLAPEPPFSAQRLGQLAAQMRPPLGNLIGAAQLLEYPREDRSPEHVEKYRAIQRKNYHILLRMLDNLDFLSAASGENTPFCPALLDFGGLCAEVIRGAQDLCAQAGCNVSLEDRGGNFLVMGEERMLRAMLYQLLSNAVRAAGTGGSTVFRLERREKAVRLTVSDSGAGFTASELARAFDPSRASNALETPWAGLGIGISICRMVVQRHGGRIALLSGDGGRVVVELPLCASVEGGELRTRRDYSGGLNETLIQLSDVLPWQSFAAGETE